MLQCHPSAPIAPAGLQQRRLACRRDAKASLSACDLTFRCSSCLLEQQLHVIGRCGAAFQPCRYRSPPAITRNRCPRVRAVQKDSRQVSKKARLVASRNLNDPTISSSSPLHVQVKMASAAERMTCRQLCAVYSASIKVSLLSHHLDGPLRS